MSGKTELAHSLPVSLRRWKSVAHHGAFACDGNAYYVIAYAR